MRFIHTSDWHLGCTLYEKKRTEEFTEFLNWLIEKIKETKAEALLIAGDIFDVKIPGNQSQTLYFKFLKDVSETCCHDIIIIAGNHDSPSLLDAPRELLELLNVHVIGNVPNDLKKEVITLEDTQGEPIGIVCAVPYLHDRDIRAAEAEENEDDRNTKLVKGITEHYSKVCELAVQKQKELEKEGCSKVPIIAMGHLFTEGGEVVKGDGVRDLYIGGLAQLKKETFPASIDYLALGHLHKPQLVGKNEFLRYSGSPLPIGFNESNQEKQIILVDINEKKTVDQIPIPCFRKLVQIKKDTKEEILRELEQLKDEKQKIWVDIECPKEPVNNLKAELFDAIKNTPIEILHIQGKILENMAMQVQSSNENLEELDPEEVFVRCLNIYEKNDEVERKELLECYKEIIYSIQNKDISNN